MQKCESGVQVYFDNENCRKVFLELAKSYGWFENNIIKKLLMKTDYKWLVLRYYTDGKYDIGGNTIVSGSFFPIVSIEQAVDIVCGRKKIRDFCTHDVHIKLKLNVDELNAFMISCESNARGLVTNGVPIHPIYNEIVKQLNEIVEQLEEKYT